MPADRLLHPRLGHSVKVSGLSDLEHRVWITYQLTADDYGVMRLSAITVQAANDALAQRAAPLIQKALDSLVGVELVESFEHQGRTYCCQLDWQNYQRVKHPRDTTQPMPPTSIMERCTSATKKLFQLHPTRNREVVQEDFGNISEMVPEPLSGNGSLACVRARETANGKRLMANGSDAAEPFAQESSTAMAVVPFDVWFFELHAAYPPNRRQASPDIQRAFVATFNNQGDPAAHFARLMAALTNHKASSDWARGYIPKLENWLVKGLWSQELAPISAQVEGGKPLPTWAANVQKRKGATT